VKSAIHATRAYPKLFEKRGSWGQKRMEKVDSVVSPRKKKKLFFLWGGGGGYALGGDNEAG